MSLGNPFLLAVILFSCVGLTFSQEAELCFRCHWATQHHPRQNPSLSPQQALWLHFRQLPPAATPGRAQGQVLRQGLSSLSPQDPAGRMGQQDQVTRLSEWGDWARPQSFPGPEASAPSGCRQGSG